MACITESGFDTNISQVLKVLDLEIPTFLPTPELRLICSALPMEPESFWPHVGKAACRLRCRQRTVSVGVTACHPQLSRRQDSCPKVFAAHWQRIILGDSFSIGNLAIQCFEPVTGRYWPVIMPCHDQNVRNVTGVRYQ
jgi:hypothetical protein